MDDNKNECFLKAFKTQRDGAKRIYAFENGIGVGEGVKNSINFQSYGNCHREFNNFLCRI